MSGTLPHIGRYRSHVSDLSRSVLVGDKDSDIEVGFAAGVKSNIKLILSGKPDAGTLEFPFLQVIADWLAHTSTVSNQSVRQRLMTDIATMLDKGKVKAS